jgi:ferredoxin
VKIEVNQNNCIAAGVCAATAPAVFDQDEDQGYVVVLEEEPDESQHAAVRVAADGCPAQVIHLRLQSAVRSNPRTPHLHEDEEHL